MNEQDLMNAIDRDERIRNAAHDMLEALKTLEFLAEIIGDRAFVVIAKAVIAKAEGQS